MAGKADGPSGSFAGGRRSRWLGSARLVSQVLFLYIRCRFFRKEASFWFFWFAFRSVGWRASERAVRPRPKYSHVGSGLQLSPALAPVSCAFPCPCFVRVLLSREGRRLASSVSNREISFSFYFRSAELLVDSPRSVAMLAGSSHESIYPFRSTRTAFGRRGRGAGRAECNGHFGSRLGKQGPPIQPSDRPHIPTGSTRQDGWDFDAWTDAWMHMRHGPLSAECGCWLLLPQRADPQLSVSCGVCANSTANSTNSTGSTYSPHLAAARGPAYSG